MKPSRQSPARDKAQGQAIWACAGVLHLLLWASLRTHWLAPFFNDSVHRFGPGADFFALYQAGYSALHGRSIYVFSRDVTAIPYGYPFRYLPVVAYTVGALLTLLSPAAAYTLWAGVCELCLLFNAHETSRRVGGGRLGALLGASWLVFTPCFLEFWVGQFTLLLGGLLFWCVLAVDDGRTRAAQGWWVASVLWKPAALLWAPVWLQGRHWKTLLICTALLAANGIYFHYFPQDWRVFVAANLTPVPTWHAGNIGLSGLIYQLTGGTNAFLVARQIINAIILLPALWATFSAGRARPTAPTPFWLLAALWTSLYFLIYKDVWEHHLTLLLPFLVLGLWRAPSPLLIVVYVLLALPSPFILYDPPGLGLNADPQPYFSWGVSLLHHSWRVLPLFTLYVYWLSQAWPRKEACRPPWTEYPNAS